MSNPHPCYVECGNCGERWKIATAPCSLSTYAAALKRAQCPCCGAHTDLYVCSTVGPDAPKGPRDGTPPGATLFPTAQERRHA